MECRCITECNRDILHIVIVVKAWLKKLKLGLSLRFVIYIDHARNYYICSISVADIVSGRNSVSFRYYSKMLQKQQYPPYNNHYPVN